MVKKNQINETQFSNPLIQLKGRTFFYFAIKSNQSNQIIKDFNFAQYRYSIIIYFLSRGTKLFTAELFTASF